MITDYNRPKGGCLASAVNHYFRPMIKHQIFMEFVEQLCIFS